MAHDDIILNGKDFEQVLQDYNIESAADTGALPAVLNGNISFMLAGTGKTVQEALDAADYTDFQSFIDSIEQFALDNGTTNTQQDLDFYTQNLYDDILVEVVDIINRNGNDWDILVDQSVIGDDAAVDALIATSAANSLDHFFATVGTTVQADLENSLEAFYTYTAYLQSANAGLTTAFNNYEEVYINLGFDASQLQPRLRAFVENAITEDGYFVPSHSFNNWYTELADELGISLDAANALLGGVNLNDPIDVVSRIDELARRQSKRTLVIDRVLRLLVAFIDVLNKISVAQSDRLEFLANWQKNYTTVLEEIETFTSGSSYPSGDPLPTSIAIGTTTASTEAASRRSDLNALNTQFIETIRARRDIVGDEAKALQAAVNESQDAANQQTSIATAILQQLSTILSAIFR